MSTRIYFRVVESIFILSIFLFGSFEVKADALSYTEIYPIYLGGNIVDISQGDWLQNYICRTGNPDLVFNVVFYKGAYPDKSSRVEQQVSGRCFDASRTWESDLGHFFNDSFLLAYGDTNPFPDGEYWLDIFVDQNDSYYFNFRIRDGVAGPLGGPVCTEECYSSVVFLPGFKGSVLELGGDTIWPPTIWSDDVLQLSQGQSSGGASSMLVSGVVEKVYSTDIYGPFSRYMRGLEENGLIKEYVPIPYDWRKSPESIVAEGVATPEGLVDIVEKISDVAERSKSGKVIIVAHSMGGLVGKALIRELEKRNKHSLVESFVMVGTPQLGAPQAVPSLLHGAGENILAGMLTDMADMRAVGYNMPGAYSLLPAQKYIRTLPSVVSFDPNTQSTLSLRNFFGETIDGYGELVYFLTGTVFVRPRPSYTDMLSPEALRLDLVSGAMDFHNFFDEYLLPENIRVVEVAGWGLETVKSIEYTELHGIPYYKPKFTREGDETVVYPSAISGAGVEKFFVNLFELNKFSQEKIKHRNILNNISVIEILENIITQSVVQNSSFVSSEKPTVVDISDALIVSSHSPVVLGAYDQQGRFTGVKKGEYVAEGILKVFEEIPGSSFVYSSESQYVFLPENNTYSFVYEGTGSGPTTIEVEKFIADDTLPVTVFSDMPTTGTTKASFSVADPSPDNIKINLDFDGNGTRDEVVFSDDYAPAISDLLTEIKSKIKSMDIKPQLKKNLEKRIENIEKKIARLEQKPKKIKQAKKALDNFTKTIEKKKSKAKLPDKEAEELIDLIIRIESML